MEAIDKMPRRKFARWIPENLLEFHQSFGRKALRGSDMSSGEQNRRDFLKSGGTAAAGAAVCWSAKSYAAIAGANDRIRVGVVGCGDRMKSALIPSFLQRSKE